MHFFFTNATSEFIAKVLVALFLNGPFDFEMAFEGCKGALRNWQYLRGKVKPATAMMASFRQDKGALLDRSEPVGQLIFASKLPLFT